MKNKEDFSLPRPRLLFGKYTGEKFEVHPPEEKTLNEGKT